MIYILGGENSEKVNKDFTGTGFPDWNSYSG